MHKYIHNLHHLGVILHDPQQTSPPNGVHRRAYRAPTVEGKMQNSSWSIRNIWYTLYGFWWSILGWYHLITTLW